VKNLKSFYLNKRDKKMCQNIQIEQNRRKDLAFYYVTFFFQKHSVILFLNYRIKIDGEQNQHITI
jgi:hypothetical protein